MLSLMLFSKEMLYSFADVIFCTIRLYLLLKYCRIPTRKAQIIMTGMAESQASRLIRLRMLPP